MRLLILTQAADLDDPALGFFHRWIEEFAAHCERVHVVCLQDGRHNLPGNVSVHSLGKEGGRSRLKYIFRFYRYTWNLRHEYDVVFVHMNEEYVLLGGLPWRMAGKRIVLWRNHKVGSWWTHVAVFFAHALCYTSPSAYVARFRNAVRMPIGIDTEAFRLGIAAPPHGSILFLGRLDPVKLPEVFLQALDLLARQGAQFHADVYGDPTYADAPHTSLLETMMAPLVRSGTLTKYPSVPHKQTPDIYRAHGMYVNITPSGSFDKTIGEAMACGCIAVVANEALRGVLPDALIVDPHDAGAVARGIFSAISLSQSDRDALIQKSVVYIAREHSLTLLVGRVMRLLR